MPDSTGNCDACVYTIKGSYCCTAQCDIHILQSEWTKEERQER